MKKFLIIAFMALISGCACFDCSDDLDVNYRTYNTPKMDCDYFDGRTCYRYTYKKTTRPVAKPAPRRYRECGNYVKPCCQQQVQCPSCNSCRNANVQETREPVEVVYKKTTHRTVCNPTTTTEVSYEKESYNPAEHAEAVEVVEQKMEQAQ